MRSVSKFIREAQRAPTPEAALRAWQQALREQPGDPQAVCGCCDALLQTGRASAAIPLLEALIREARSSSEVHALLGEAYMLTGQPSPAADQFQLALLFDADSAQLHNNLSVALLSAGRFEEAVAAAGQALALDADYKEAHVNLATSLQRLGRNAEAILSLERAASLAPDEWDARERLGTALRVAGRFDASREAFEACVGLAPGNALSHYNLGLSYFDAHRWQEAEPHFRRATELAPDFLGALIRLGQTYIKLMRYAEAIACFEKVLSLDPHHQNALCYLPYWYMNMGRFAEAEPLIETALAVVADRASIENLICLRLMWKAQIEEAIIEGQRILREYPEQDDVRNNLSQWLLSLGHYEEGFREYEWRLKEMQKQDVIGPAKYWDGRPLPGQTLVVAQEQGIGDTIMFARYLPLVKERVGALKVTCLEPIAPVLATIPGIDEIISFRNEDPTTYTPCHAHVCFPSLPFIFKTTLDTIPPAPYLSADPVRAALWRERMANDGPGLKIGLAWAGNPEFQSDSIRSPGIEALAPLASVPGVRFYSLQKGAGRDQLPRCPRNLEMIDLGPQLTDFAETAAALIGLDLLISSCTSIVHLAGALGVQTWVALSYSPDWRWMWNRSDSPWYPSLRLFRQPSLGDWRAVYGRMAEELTRFAMFASAG